MFIHIVEFIIRISFAITVFHQHYAVTVFNQHYAVTVFHQHCAGYFLATFIAYIYILVHL